MLLAVPGLALLGLLMLGQYLVWYGKRDTARRADAIIIFGARVWPGGKPSPILYQRTRKAFELWRSGLAPVIICTGGVGDYPPAESHVEAELLEQWGVPKHAIRTEHESHSTHENVEFAAKLLRPEERRVIAVSDSFHLWRCARECRDKALTVYTAHSIGYDELPAQSRLFYAVREAVLMLRSFIWD
jgi:uncharacterized SAM-binding protein YcdF (DUF218 family)